MTAENLISRLTKVKKTGPDRWLACCPAHDDKSPSLAIKELGDQRILLHCFAGCSPQEILDAIGLTFDELFPEKLMDHGKPLRKPFPAADVLEAVSTETLIVAMTASRLANDKDITVGDWQRLHVAAQRIMAARDMVNG
ncbi:CHC2 zinc finger [Nitrosospira sp. Nsp11]|uniref:CHC2 zinc finger domain-containing protein n=1 Tax=Nitrosospira sp. Nsp11 TaxID=1855338 RepID=UPI000911ACA6|nr:CHC2 zinc finger domain-containing protein [Nitrosospira sp. Nsp11]SHM05517.1 CHC2 zinc finger [Nitrosospira sp. Nsp11]